MQSTFYGERLFKKQLGCGIKVLWAHSENILGCKGHYCFSSKMLLLHEERENLRLSIQMEMMREMLSTGIYVLFSLNKYILRRFSLFLNRLSPAGNKLSSHLSFYSSEE